MNKIKDIFNSIPELKEFNKQERRLIFEEWKKWFWFLKNKVKNKVKFLIDEKEILDHFISAYKNFDLEDENIEEFSIHYEYFTEEDYFEENARMIFILFKDMSNFILLLSERDNVNILRHTEPKTFIKLIKNKTITKWLYFWTLKDHIYMSQLQ